MKKLLVVVLVLVMGIGALGYWRGWFSVTHDGKVDVQVDAANFKKDKDAFSASAHAQLKSAKAKVGRLWTKAKGLTGDEKVQTEKELAALEKKHERLEKQLGELESAGSDRFDSIKQDLSKNLEAVEQKIDELTQKLAKENGK